MQGYSYLRSPGPRLRQFRALRDRLAPWLPIPYRLPWGGWMLLFKNHDGDAILGGYYNEQNELNLLCSLLKPGMTFLDLGANQGLYSIVASGAVGRHGRVYAFEPVPSEYWRLCANRLFNRARNIHTEQLAVTDAAGRDFIYAVAPTYGSFSSMRPPASDVSVPVRKIEVRTTMLDGYLSANGIGPVDILKMDVEGAEMAVVRGSMGIWSSGPRPIVFTEVNDKRTVVWGYRGSDLLQFFIEYGYHLFEGTAEGVRPHSLREEYGFTNVVIVPEEKLSVIEPYRVR